MGYHYNHMIHITKEMSSSLMQFDTASGSGPHITGYVT